MVTAELAVVLPALLLVLAVALSALGLAVDQVRCVDAAAAGAGSCARPSARCSSRPSRGCPTIRRSACSGQPYVGLAISYFGHSANYRRRKLCSGARSAP